MPHASALPIVLTLVSALLHAPPFHAPAHAAPEDTGPSWRDTKCVRYRAAWTNALARLGRDGLGDEFLRRHEAFLGSGCTGEHDVCPRTPAELNLANIMVVRAMNAGTASTFPPFGCR